MVNRSRRWIDFATLGPSKALLFRSFDNENTVKERGLSVYLTRVRLGGSAFGVCKFGPHFVILLPLCLWLI